MSVGKQFTFDDCQYSATSVEDHRRNLRREHGTQRRVDASGSARRALRSATVVALRVHRQALVLLVALAATSSWWLPATAHAQSGTQIAHSQHGYPYPNAPDCSETGTAGCVVDQWSFYQGQCTSWVAYRLNQLNGFAFNNFYGGSGRWSDASLWGGHARALGIAVDGTPALGAVAWYASGHVAYVEQVNSPTSVVISEMNHDYHNGFRLRTISPGNGWPSGFIHIRDRAGALGDGDFVADTSDGRVYVIAGGAPLYVSSWGAVGGPKPTIGLSHQQLLALPTYPRDGTLLGGSSGGVFVVAGGAPIYVSHWGAIGGPRPVTGVDQWAIDHAGNPYSHLRAYPVDGTLLGGSTGGVFTVAGGAPIYVSHWASIGGERPVVGVDQWAIDHTDHPWAHLRPYPADGTLVGASDGNVYILAGGAPLYLSTWEAIGGPQPSTPIDRWAIENPQHPWAHLRAYPADGTLLNTLQDGAVYRVAGGAPIYVASWGAIGGQQPSVGVDKWVVDNAGHPASHLRPYPADGTLLNALPAGAVYRVAGGAPILVRSWSAIGGQKPSVAIDQWAVGNAGSRLSHLRAHPADGTVVRGMPSGQHWTFTSGQRHPSAGRSDVIDVDDAGLLAFPTAQPQTSDGPVADDHGTSTATLSPGQGTAGPDRTLAPMRNLARPSLNGRGRVGRSLRCGNGVWSHDSRTLTHRWQRSGRPISGARGLSYRLRRADRARLIRCVVTATGTGGRASATSRSVRVR